MTQHAIHSRICCGIGVVVLAACCASILPARAEILWSDLGSRVIHKTPVGLDMLAGKVSRDDTANDALYFKFHVDPLSDVATEEYYALFQLAQNNENHLAVGNAPEAWGFGMLHV